MVQIQGIEGEAVVTYREPSITKETRYPRLSRRVKNMTNLLASRISRLVNSEMSAYHSKHAVIIAFVKPLSCFYAT